MEEIGSKAAQDWRPACQRSHSATELEVLLIVDLTL
jgi:hypothetical protein